VISGTPSVIIRYRNIYYIKASTFDVMMETRSVNGIEISGNARDKYEEWGVDRSIESVISNSVHIKIDDDYGSSRYSPAMINEEVGAVFPIRNRDGKNGKGFPTVLKMENVTFKGSLIECQECGQRCHSERKSCMNCGSELFIVDKFYWKGIEVTPHSQLRLVQRSDVDRKDVQGVMKKILNSGIFVTYEDGYEGETTAILNENLDVVIPLRNREDEKGVGITTILTNADISKVEGEILKCDICDSLYHEFRDHDCVG
jgi:hypothetical protein